MLDQAMLSATNMAVALLFIKFSSKFEYGEYSLALAVIMFASGLHNSLINTPIMITAKKIEVSARPTFLASLCLFLYLIIFLFFIIIAFCLLAFPDSLPFRSRTSWALLFATAGILSRELIRSLFFFNLEVLNVFIVDSVYSSLFLVSLVILYVILGLTSNNVIICMGICSVIAALIYFRRALTIIRLPESLERFYESILLSLKDTRWTVAGMVLGWIVNNGYLFVLDYLVSKEAVAELNGTRVLIVPLIIIMGAWSKIFMPKGSSMVYKKQYNSIINVFLKSTTILVILSLVYISVFYFSSNLLSIYLYENRYHRISSYILLWGFFVIVTIICTNLQNLISIFSRFKQLFLFSLINSSLFVIYSFILINKYAGFGAISSLIVAKIVLALQYCTYYLTKRHEMFVS